MGVLSFPAHGPKRAYVALCALYPVCAELFLPYESSADRHPAKPKPLAYMLRVYRDRETDRNIPFSVLLPHLAARQIQPGYRPLNSCVTQTASEAVYSSETASEAVRLQKIPALASGVAARSDRCERSGRALARPAILGLGGIGWGDRA